jgi:hypothetical protein
MKEVHDYISKLARVERTSSAQDGMGYDDIKPAHLDDSMKSNHMNLNMETDRPGKCF